jgi:3-deoxy-D-manno-octulosonic-acid transferase
VLRTLYNALWYPALPFALAAAGAKDPADRAERLGRIHLPPMAVAAKKWIWLHAASVGEIEGVRPIVAGLLRDHVDCTLVVTTMTIAGRDAARRRLPQALTCALAPLDWASSVRRFLQQVRPGLVLIAETELWPNYFFESRDFGAKVAIINGRISARSLNGYRWAHSLFAEVLACADLILAQSDDDARRYQWLGASQNSIVVTGSAKYDLDSLDGRQALRPELEAFAAGKPILIAGSTARGEDEVVVKAYLGLLKRFPDLALVIAPRHLERLPEVEQAIRVAGLPYANASDLHMSEGSVIPGVLILDTIGELRTLYRRAKVAFVGGSLLPGRGGQNLAEPAGASVPVLFGPYHETQQQVASALIAAGGGGVVKDAFELEQLSAGLLANEAARNTAGRNARAAVEKLATGLEPTLMRLRALASFS